MSKEQPVCVCVGGGGCSFQFSDGLTKQIFNIYNPFCNAFSGVFQLKNNGNTAMKTVEYYIFMMDLLTDGLGMFINSFNQK